MTFLFPVDKRQDILANFRKKQQTKNNEKIQKQVDELVQQYKMEEINFCPLLFD